jgi:hypothetical protein
MTIVRLNQMKETYIAGSDRPETGFKGTSVDSSADSDQFDQSRDLQARERRPFDRLDVETGTGTALNKGNEKWHPDLSGINRSQSVNSPELHELVEAVFGLTDRQFQRRKGPHGGIRLGTNFAGDGKRQLSSGEFLERPAHYTAADTAAGAETKSVVNNSDK